MKLIFVLSVVALVVAAGFALVQSRQHESTLAGRVTYVIDGDTVVVRLASARRVHVRVIGVNTPEIAHYGRPGECFGIRAARLTRRLTLGHRVLLRPGRERLDRYGRLLAYIHVIGGPDELERSLLVRGAARTMAIAPNTDRAAVYSVLERAARRARRGLWGACASR